MNKSNLDELVTQINLDDLENKTDSNFTINELMKYVVFEMDGIKNITSYDYNFDFNINGKTNVNLEPITINTSLELTEVNDKAKCNFIVVGNNSANLNCNINLEKYKNYKTFSFKTSKIITDDKKEITFSKINELMLVKKEKEQIEEEKEENKEEEKEQEKEMEKENEKEIKIKDKFTFMIVICVIVGILILGGIIFIIFYKKCKSKKEKNNMSKRNGNNNNIININNDIKEKNNINDRNFVCPEKTDERYLN